MWTLEYGAFVLHVIEFDVRAGFIYFLSQFFLFLLSSLPSPVDFACLCYISVPFSPLI